MLKLVTLNTVVEGVILRGSQFLTVAVSTRPVVSTLVAQDTTLGSDALNPESLTRHTSVTGTVALTIASVAALGFSLGMPPETITGNIVIIALIYVSSCNELAYFAT